MNQSNNSNSSGEGLPPLTTKPSRNLTVGRLGVTPKNDSVTKLDATGQRGRTSSVLQHNPSKQQLGSLDGVLLPIHSKNSGESKDDATVLPQLLRFDATSSSHIKLMDDGDVVHCGRISRTLPRKAINNQPITRSVEQAFQSGVAVISVMNYDAPSSEERQAGRHLISRESEAPVIWTLFSRPLTSTNPSGVQEKIPPQINRVERLIPPKIDQCVLDLFRLEDEDTQNELPYLKK